MIKAVIFDLDGTLVDAFDEYVLTFNKALKDKGYPDKTAKEIGKYYGQSVVEILRKLMSKLSIDNEVKDVRLRHEDYWGTNGLHLKILPGAIELITALQKQKIPLAIASSAGRKIIEYDLEKMNIKKSIAAIVSADDIKNSKPHPEIFLRAAEKLNVNPENCLVFEDSIHGILAAKAANMKCVAVTTGTTPREELEKLHPNYVFDSLKETLPPKLDNILKI